MHKIAFMPALALALAVSGAAFAQSTTDTTNRPAGCNQIPTGRSAAGFHNRDAHPRLAKSRIYRRAGSSILLLSSGQNQGRQSDFHDYRPTWHERCGNVDVEDAGKSQGEPDVRYLAERSCPDLAKSSLRNAQNRKSNT